MIVSLDGRRMGRSALLASREKCRLNARFLDLFRPSVYVLPESPRARALIGRTLRPDVAQAYLGTLELDGTGRVLGIHRALSATVVEKLEAGITTPLSRVNGARPRSAPRTERDGLVHLLAALRTASGPEAAMLSDDARALWLRGNLARGRVIAFYEKAAERLRGNPELGGLVASLLADARALKTPAQYHENLYGRAFDSAFVDELVRHPPPGVIANARTTGKALYRLLDPVTEGPRPNAAVVSILASIVGRDPRPWFGRTSELGAFLAEPSLRRARAMLETVDDGYDVMKVSLLGVRVGWALQHVGLPPSWLHAANEEFHAVIGPARTTFVAPAARRTASYGVRLAHQPPFTTPRDFTYAKSWADDKTIDFGNASVFEKRALLRGHAVVNGASGSTNILAFLHRDLAAGDPSYHLGDALLGTAMFLTYDGGHSINEVAAVHDTVLNQVSAEAGRKRLAGYDLDYRRMASGAGTGEDARIVGAALDRALDRTIDHCDTWSVQSVRAPFF